MSTFHGNNLPALMRDPGLVADGQVSILTADESHRLAAATTGRFPALNCQEIDWGRAPFRSQRFYHDHERDWPGVASEILSEHAGRTAILWGGGSIPDVVAETALVIQHAEDIVNAQPAFWLHPWEATRSSKSSSTAR
ncbi:hypothetical protein AB0M02_35480 [Actinoplanes sp. NPDC051861]|uniref:hypothetical protein n=1 Tax=Actinoplanes sp. NPDC051861 TaxID=3155170 RepID=UPI003442EC91